MTSKVALSSIITSYRMCHNLAGNVSFIALLIIYFECASDKCLFNFFSRKRKKWKETSSSLKSEM